MTWKSMVPIIVLGSAVVFVVGSHPWATTAHHRWAPRYQLFAPLPAGSGVGFQVGPTKPGPATYDRADFRRVHFARNGTVFDFTFLNARVVLHPNPPLTAAAGYPKIVLNRPIPVGTSWVRTVVLHQVGHNIVVTCNLARSAKQVSLYTSPPEFDWEFKSK